MCVRSSTQTPNLGSRRAPRASLIPFPSIPIPSVSAFCTHRSAFCLRSAAPPSLPLSRSHHLVLNTAATYFRSVFALGLTLFSSRWVLQALGTGDFGTYSVITSLTVFVTFINGILANSVARHLAFAIGENKPGEVRRWFNTALSLHIAAAILLVALGWPLGHWFIEKHMTIAPERLATAERIFDFGLVGAFCTMVAIPYAAIFTAKQRITELAVLGIAQALLIFGLALRLRHSSGDPLQSYGLGMAVIVVLVQTTTVVRASWLYSECRLVPGEWFDTAKAKEVLHFAGWNLFGGLGATLRNSGLAILLNLQFGPQTNAAYGVATQISNATNQLANALMGALTPEMTTSEGRGERQRMLQLAQRMNKYGTLIVLLFALPLMLQMEFVLTLWLKTPPAHAVTFCRLVLLVFVLDRLSSGYMLAVSAHGKIAAYQATLGSFLILTLPVAWAFLHLGAPPQAVYWASLITISLCSGGRVIWARKLFGVPVRAWISETLLPCAKVATISGVVGWAILQSPVTDLMRFLGCFTVTAATGLLVALFYGTDRDERKAFSSLCSFRRTWNKNSG